MRRQTRHAREQHQHMSSKDGESNVREAHLEIVYDAFSIQKVIGNDKEVPVKHGCISQYDFDGDDSHIPIQRFIPPFPLCKSSLCL